MFGGKIAFLQIDDINIFFCLKTGNLSQNAKCVTQFFVENIFGIIKLTPELTNSDQSNKSIFGQGHFRFMAEHFSRLAAAGFNVIITIFEKKLKH
jgi:hypothetical protein